MPPADKMINTTNGKTLFANMNLTNRIKSTIRKFLNIYDAEFALCPLFVVSCGRSGSTALCSALRAHPQIHMAINEAPLLHRVGGLCDNFFHSDATDYHLASMRISENILRDSLRKLCIESVFGTDLSLPHNPFTARGTKSIYSIQKFRHWGCQIFPSQSDLDGLRYLFPNAKVIYLHRNGIEVVHSMAKKNWFCDLSFEKRCHLWADSVFRYDYLDRDEMSFTVRHQNFLHHPKELFDNLFSWLGIIHSSQPAIFSSSNIVHPLGCPTRQGSIIEELKNRPPPGLQWNADERDIFCRICGEAMEKLGYPVVFDE